MTPLTPRQRARLVAQAAAVSSLIDRELGALIAAVARDDAAAWPKIPARLRALGYADEAALLEQQLGRCGE